MEALFTFLASYWWVLLIFAGMGYGAFEEWLSFRREQEKLGASTAEMSDDISELKQEWNEERARLTRRIEHLEAIVTSQTWDEVVEPSRDLPPPLELEKESQNSELSAEERAQQLAQRIR